MGFGPYFINMLQAIHSTATLAIVIQGRNTQPIQLTHSLWQGCLLLPLLYIAFANALSCMLFDASDQRLIQGVFLPETGEQHTHSQFADNAKVITVAKREYVNNTFALFQTFGEASRFFIKEIGVKAFLILEGPILQELLDLPFVWEAAENPSKVVMEDKISLKAWEATCKKHLKNVQRLHVGCLKP